MTGQQLGDDYLAMFSAAPGLAVALMAPDGTTLFCNETAATMFGGGTAAEHIGRKLTELYPREWAEEKIALLRRVAETDERLLIRYIWEGKRVEAQYQRIPDHEAGGPRILVTIREGVTEDRFIPEGFEIVKIDTSNFGPLSVLTPRELEVLALIGQGKSAKEIADTLGCSPRTVERHRDSIGKKLNKNDRVSLALVAQAAGLELRDAHLKQVGPMPKPAAPKPVAPRPSSQIEPSPGGARVTPQG
jgi:DNA-binding CsgD family transcriptional regulator